MEQERWEAANEPEEEEEEEEEPRKKYVPPQSKCYVPNAAIKSYQRESVLRQTSREKEREVVAPAQEEEESEVVMLIECSLFTVELVCLHVYMSAFFYRMYKYMHICTV